MYLATTFSPSMLTPGCYATVEECGLEMIKSYWLQIESVVSHEATAEVLSTLLEFKVEFNRTNVTLGHGDILFAVIPKFRASEAREFTRKEVESAGYRAFYVEVWSREKTLFPIISKLQTRVEGSSISNGFQY